MTSRRFAAAVLAILAGIGAQTAGGQQAASELPPELRSELLEPWTGDLDGMIERRTIRLLTPYNLVSFFFDGACNRGFEVNRAEMLQKLVNVSRERAADEVHVLLIPTPRDRLMSGVETGLGDIAGGGLTATRGRRTRVDFSPPFVTDVREIVVSHPDYGPVTSLESLSGRQVYVHASSSYYESLEAANQGLRKAGLAPIDVQKIDETLHLGGILEMVHAGILPATVADEHVARFWHQVFPKLVLHSEAVLREKGDIAWVIRKNSPQLQTLLEGFVKRHGARTAYQRQLSERHLKGKKLITNPSATANFKRFQSLLPLFRKYGEKYQLDPLMLAAQGYQESRLRQDAVSHVGAIGVMQIMPATGADLRVGDISLLEPNVHGGAKYMRQIIDRYLATDEVANVDQMLFALAAYNAGPNRVNRLRGVAEKEGLDANRWFNHTERIVARKVGREPIRYVRNIYRYYLAYRIALDRGAAPDKP